MMLDLVSASGEVHRLGILDKECAVRVAHARRDRISFDRQVKGIHLSRERDLLPTREGRAHIDPGQPAAGILAFQHAARCPKTERACSSLVHKMAGDTARCIAAGGSGGSVRVEEGEPSIRLVVAFNDRELIESHTSVPVPHGTRQCSRHSPSALTAVDHDKVVAEPVHLHERQARGGGLSHDCANKPSSVSRKAWNCAASA